MSETHLPQDWATWIDLVRSALRPGPPIPHEQLLLVTDMEGRHLRRLDPPTDVVSRKGAVLLIFYPDSHDLRIPLTVRSNTLPTHRGEVSLPGGATDPDDDGPTATALREGYEELGIDPESIDIWGTLSPLYIPPSNFYITPVVGFSKHHPHMQVNTAEVQEVITVTVRELLDPQRVVVEQWQRQGIALQVPFFAIAGHKVWGATAMILSELVARIRRSLLSNEET
ncbi:MAG: CoA pyrophosphatase [Chloroflexota bacterium]